MSTEAQKKASKKYYLAHREYYREKTRESMKRIRRQRREYKSRIDEARELLYNERNRQNAYQILINSDELLDILEGKNEYNR